MQMDFEDFKSYLARMKNTQINVPGEQAFLNAYEQTKNAQSIEEAKRIIGANLPAETIGEEHAYMEILNKVELSAREEASKTGINIKNVYWRKR